MKRADAAPVLREIDWIDRTRIPELVALYRDEWWTRGRPAEEVREMRARSDVVERVGLWIFRSNNSQ
jgi:hypothetical protein